MTQAARPLPPVPVAPRRPPLRLVAHTPAARGAAAAGAVRRRRAVAVAGLLVLAALPFAWLSATRAPAGDRTAITALLRAGERDPASLCGHLSAAMLSAAGGRAACVRASPERAPAGSIGAVRVSGATATAVVRRAGGAERVRLVRQDGAWRIDDIR